MNKVSDLYVSCHGLMDVLCGTQLFICCTTRGSHRWQKPIWMWRTNLSLVQGKLVKLFKITMINCRNPTIFRELDIVPKIVCGFASCTSHVFPSRVGLPTCTSCKATAKFFDWLWFPSFVSVLGILFSAQEWHGWTTEMTGRAEQWWPWRSESCLKILSWTRKMKKTQLSSALIDVGT